MTKKELLKGFILKMQEQQENSFDRVANMLAVKGNTLEDESRRLEAIATEIKLQTMRKNWKFTLANKLIWEY